MDIRGSAHMRQTSGGAAAAMFIPYVVRHSTFF
jgi:hypothetical protein